MAKASKGSKHIKVRPSGGFTVDLKSYLKEPAVKEQIRNLPQIKNLPQIEIPRKSTTSESGKESD